MMCKLQVVEHYSKNVWTKHYSQPPNLILDGFQMTQTIHDFVERGNPTKNSPKWSCSRKQWWFRNFLLEMP